MHSNRAALRSILLASTVLLATACNSNTPDTSAPAASTTTAASAASAAASTNDAVASPAASPAASSSQVADATSAATSTAADPPATDAKAPPPTGMPAGPAPVEGTDYTLIDTPDQPSGDKVQVTEVFGYGCPHCNALQPALSTWEKKVPSDVQFTYLPAAFGPGAPHCWDEFARAFFAALAMGIPTARDHDGIYKAVWDQHRFNQCSDIPALFADYGPDPKVFASTMQSFAINAKIASAHDQEMRWGVDGTPTIVIDGKYRVPAAESQAMLHTVEWLIAKQRPLHAKH